MTNFEKLDKDLKIFIASLLTEKVNLFEPTTFKDFINFSKTSKANNAIAKDDRVWKTVLRKIIHDCGYHFTDEKNYLSGFDQNIKELALLVIQHNIRTHFRKWTESSSERNKALETSIEKLSNLAQSNPDNVLIQLLLAELTYVHQQYTQCEAICQSYYEKSLGFKILNFLCYLKKNNIGPPSTSLKLMIGKPNFKQRDVPQSIRSEHVWMQQDWLKPYLNFPLTILEALVIHPEAVTRVLNLLQSKAETENTIAMLVHIKQNILLTLMYCSFSDKVIEKLNIMQIIQFGNSEPNFAVVPDPSLLYLLCNSQLEHLDQLANKAQEIYSLAISTRTSNILIKNPQSLIKDTKPLNRYGFLRMLKHFNALEIMNLSWHVFVYNEQVNLLPRLCEMEDKAFDEFINKLKQFETFYVNKVSAKSFSLDFSAILCITDKLDMLLNDFAVPLLKKFSLDGIFQFDKELLKKLCSEDTSQLINCFCLDNLKRINSECFPLINKIAQFADGKLFKDDDKFKKTNTTWLTITQILNLSIERKQILSTLLPIIGNWERDQFRLILKLGKQKANPFDLDSLKNLNKIADFIPQGFSFEQMKQLIEFNLLLQELATKCYKSNCSTKVVLERLSLKEMEKARLLSVTKNESLLYKLCNLDPEQCRFVLEETNNNLEKLLKKFAVVNNLLFSQQQPEKIENSKNKAASTCKASYWHKRPAEETAENEYEKAISCLQQAKRSKKEGDLPEAKTNLENALKQIQTLLVEIGSKDDDLTQDNMNIDTDYPGKRSR